MPPKVSIVTATYNRSNVLRHAIESVRRQTLTDWEMIIVGDKCSDDTADVVASFQDGRLRFINLDENHGEQSVPNNVGVAAARGEYLAFLNHDDLWLANHLQRCIEVLETHGGDFVAASAVAQTETALELIGGIGGAVRPYDPGLYCPASVWVMRSALADRVGPWRNGFELRKSTSYDWLVRAYRGGANMLADPVVTAVILPSRPRSYSERADSAQIDWAGRVTDPNALIAIVSQIAGSEVHRRQWSPISGLRGAAAAFLRSAFLGLGLWPPMPRYWIMYWRKGALIKHLRRNRGLSATRSS
jgi:glycosyltransferase involved in cell wall biosynthesis